MITPEQNEIDISKLFAWGKQINLYDVNNQIIMSCFIRLIGDAEINRARIYALRRSAEMRKKLKTENSDERLAFIADIDLITKEELIKYILVLKTKNLAEQIYRDIDVPFPKEPRSDAKLEEFEKHQKEVDDYPNRVQTEIRNKLDRQIKEEESKLQPLSKEELFKIYEREVIDDTCQLEMINAFRDICVYFGTYKDDKYTERVFKEITQFQALPTDLKTQFQQEYDSLEIDMETLKK